jgi:hypothetical protein
MILDVRSLWLIWLDFPSQDDPRILRWRQSKKGSLRDNLGHPSGQGHDKPPP